MSSNMGPRHAGDETELESLLAKQAEINARIASLLPSSAPTSFQHQQRSPIYKQHSHRRRDNVPRSMSTTSMARQSSDRIEAPPHPARSISQRSAPSMARTNSKGSTSTRSGPFLQTGAMPPLLTNVRQENPVIEAWTNHQEQPLSSYTFSHQRSKSQRQSNLEHVPELENVGEDPAAFLSREGFAPTFSFTPSPISIPSTTPSRARMSSINTHQTYNNLYTPTTPTSDSQSLTTATTLASNTMSRQNSLFNEPIVESIEMMKFNSNTSFPTDYSTDQVIYDQVTLPSTSSRYSRPSNAEQSQLLVGAGGAGNDSHFSHTFSSQEKYPQFQSSASFGEKMEKSQSNESISSTSSSLSSRSKQSLRASIELAASRRLAPKGVSDSHAMSRDNSSQSMIRLESKDGSSKDKIAIPKPTYQRPKHDRVQCTQCDDHPDGFRGEHELRRHQDRQHKTRVKKWVCMLPSTNSELQSALKPAVPLSRCKSCQQGKQYGAYYNAAAHLRRAHFKPKSKGRAKSHAKLETPQKRGGNGGGDWPKMEELKPWMIEVEVDVLPTDYALTNTQQEEADASEDDNCDTFLDDSPSSNTIIPNISGGAFENPYLMTDPTFAAYPSPHNDDMYNMTYIDLSPQNIDTSTLNCAATNIIEDCFDTFNPTCPSSSSFSSNSISISNSISNMNSNDQVQNLSFDPSTSSSSISHHNTHPLSFDDSLLSGVDNVYSFPSSSHV